jgi:hypothetical protein
MISAFDERSFKLNQIYTVGGRPAGLTLAGAGKTLLVADAVTGAVTSMPVHGKAAQPSPVIALGPGAPPQLGPQSVAGGQTTMLWAQGFAPGEPVDVYWVYWGAKPLARAIASPTGIVTVAVTVPPRVGLGDHMLIIYGRRSTTSESVLVHITPAPPVVKHVRRTVRPHKPTVLDHLLSRGITVPNPLAAIASKSKRTGHAAAQAGIQVPIVLLPLVPLLLLMARMPSVLRKRKARKLEKQSAKPQRKGRRQAAAKVKRAA